MTLSGVQELPPRLWGKPTKSVLYVPNVSIIGSIPYRNHAVNQLPPGYANTVYAKRPLGAPSFRTDPLSLLFESGDRFSPTIRNMSFINKSKDRYRGALWFKDIKLYLDSNGNICGLEGTIGRSVGSTPVRPSFFIKNATKMARFTSGEVREIAPEVVTGNNTYILTCRLEFRLGGFPDLVQAVMIGHLAPWVWVEMAIHFKVENNKAEVFLEYNSSSMPSWTAFSGTHPIDNYDMTTLSSQDVNNFLQINPTISFARAFKMVGYKVSLNRSTSVAAPARPLVPQRHYLSVSRRK